MSVVLAAAPASLRAGPFDFSTTFSDYGPVVNFAAPLPGICAPAEIMNSFVYLDTQFGLQLVPGDDPNRDAFWMAMVGWQAPGQPHRDGYYQRITAPGLTDHDFDTILLDTKTQWLNDWAPNSTMTESMIVSADGKSGFPTVDFLKKQMEDKEDVELIIEKVDGSFAHAVALTDISSDANGILSVKFQDPNDPTHEKSSALFPNPLNHAELEMVYEGQNVVIRSALAESPKAPEPSSIVLAALGAIGLIAHARRRRKRRDG